MAAVDRFLSDEVARYNDGLEWDDMIGSLSREAFVADKLAKFLLGRGYLVQHASAMLTASLPSAD